MREVFEDKNPRKHVYGPYNAVDDIHCFEIGTK